MSASSEEFYEIDPTGDTLLVLHNPDAPFAGWDAQVEHPAVYDVNWTFKWPGDDDSSNEESVFTRMESSDTQDTRLPGEGPVRMRLSSNALRLSASTFSKMLSGHWKEGIASSDCAHTIETRDWGRDAMLIVMRIIHHKAQAVPRIISLELLASIALLVDFYECNEAVGIFGETWIKNLGPTSETSNWRELRMRLVISRVFHDYNMFRAMTRIFIREGNGPIPQELPLPMAIFGEHP